MDPELHKITEAIQSIGTAQQIAGNLLKVYREELESVQPVFIESAENLIHYLALRQQDMEPVMEILGSLGLSRLYKAERDVINKRNTVLHQLHRTLNPDYQFDLIPLEKFNEGKNREQANTTALLGPEINDRSTRIMVTLPSDAAYDYNLILDLINSGVSCMRINCAHDGPEMWKMMVDKIGRARTETNKDCRICMDLSGPKFRTGSMRPGPKVIRLRPEKNEYGMVTNPRQFWIAPPENLPEDPATPHIPVERSWYDLLKKGSLIDLVDARRKKRRFKIVEESFRGKWAITTDTTYVRTGTRLHLLDHQKKKTITTEVGELIPLEERIILHTGDTLLLHKDPVPGEPAVIAEDGKIITPAHISCPLEEIFRDTRPGEKILLDDGKIEGVIEKVNPEEITIRITWADEAGSRLAADKGINLPESNLRLNGLTEKDREDLEFISRHADIVSVSFIKSAEDVKDVRKAITKVKGEHLGVILKIETQQGYKNLPDILLAAMQLYPVGIMIARGDLAVEVGWQNLAEVQEEILKLCSAAHIPDIWATQVLETLAKKGRPSRAEITDAAMAQRADCVMLNKGPHILAAIKMLDEIIRIMQKAPDERKPFVKVIN